MPIFGKRSGQTGGKTATPRAKGMIFADHDPQPKRAAPARTQQQKTEHRKTRQAERQARRKR